MSCGNCGHNCCCNCEQYVDECRYCDIQCHGSRNGGPSSGNIKHNDYIDYDYDYASHLICFSCRKCWKKSDKYPHDDRNIPKRKKELEFYERDPEKVIACSTCGNKGQIVGKNLRIPKKSKNGKWKLLEKLVKESFDDLRSMKPVDVDANFLELFGNSSSKYKVVSFEERWKRNEPNGAGRHRTIIFGDTHVPYPYNYPTQLREYNSFLKTLKTGKYLITDYGHRLRSPDRWNILKAYCKTLSIINYWKKYAEIKKKLNFDPKCNVIAEYDSFKFVTTSATTRTIFPKDLLIKLSTFLFV